MSKTKYQTMSREIAKVYINILVSTKLPIIKFSIMTWPYDMVT